MILTGTNTEIIRGGDFSESAFSIKASGQAFKILSDGLYSNKKKAIIRELCCNAYDSHVAAGCPDKPFKVVFPSLGENTLIIQDFGTGLDDFECRGGWKNVLTGEKITHEQAEELLDSWKDSGSVGESPLTSYQRFGGVFNTYFESTKTSSNDFIGALGLGSKSPFSYTDSYTVVSVKNGKKNAYSCFLSEDGVPSMALLLSENTKEKNGVAVSFPVNRSDVSAFISEAEEVLQWFEPKPIIEGATLTFNTSPPLMHGEIDGKGWKIMPLPKYSYYGTAKAIQGKIAYTIDQEPISRGVEAEHFAKLRYLLNMNLAVEFNIGDLEVSASRETLGYKTQTVNNIVDRLTKIDEQLREQFKNSTKDCKTRWEAHLTFAKLSKDGSIARIISECGIPFDGKLIKSNVVSNANHTMEGNGRIVYYGYHRGSYSARTRPFKLRECQVVASDEKNEKVTFVLNDAPHAIARCKKFVTDNGGKVVLIDAKYTTPTSTVKFDVDVAAFIKGMGEPEYVLASSLPFVPPKRSPGSGVRSSAVKVWTDRRSPVSADEDFDFDDGGVYFPTYRNDLVSDTGSAYGFTQHDLIELCINMGWANEVYQASASVHKKFAKSDAWEHLVDFTKRKIKEELEKDSLFFDRLTERQAYRYGSTPPWLRFMFADYSTSNLRSTSVNALGKDHELVVIANRIIDSSKVSDDDLLLNVIKCIMPEVMTTNTNVSVKSNADMANHVLTKYPMLRWVDAWSYDTIDINRVAEYIKMIDAKE